MNILEAKGLPCSEQSERMILGSILLQGGEVFAQCDAALTAEDFSSERHREIFDACRDLDARGVALDRVTIAEDLQKRGRLEAIGGLTYLISLDDGMPVVSSVDDYVRIVRDKSTLRKIIFACRNLAARCMSGEESADVLANADTILSRLADRDNTQSDWQNPGQIIANYPGGFEAFVTPSRGGQGIVLPWKGLNTTLCGLQSGDMAILAGRPSHGKSAAALQIAIATAQAGHGVAYFSLEMSQESLVRRLISMTGQVDSQKMRLGFLDATARQSIRKAAKQMEDSPLWIDHRGYSTPAIRRAVKRLRASREIRLVIVDHFHLLQSIGREEERQKFNRCADDLQRYAKEFNCAFLILAQLNRKCEDENRAPGLSDLAETGKLEQNADIVLFTYRPELYSKNRGKEEMRGMAEFIVGKQRNGPVGKQDMQFFKDFQRFEEAI